MNHKGFSLIELIVAIAILGIITLIAIPSVKIIQNNNKTSKYNAYEKSIKVASKAYTDAFDEDLFGATNTGCATISYSDLKEKDLISDIQIKNNSCNNDSETFIYVMKSKNGNHAYYSNIVCKEGNTIVYSNKEDGRRDCNLEDGNGPTAEIIVNPNKTIYYLGDNPKARIRISDSGVGLKENQVLAYTWYKNGRAITSEKTIEFKNKNYQGSVQRNIDMPTNLEEIDESTTYLLKVTGTLYDVDNNQSSINIEKKIEYFVGALFIKYNVNGGYMVDPYNRDYSIKNNYIVYKNTENLVQKVKYKASFDLWNYNGGWINIRKNYYHMDAGKEWTFNNNVYDHNKSYKTSDFDVSDDDLIREDKIIEVVANWKKNICTINFSTGGGTFTTNSRDLTFTGVYDTYVDSSDPIYGLRNLNGGHYSAILDYYHVDSNMAWVNSENSLTYAEGGIAYKTQDICRNLNNNNESVVLTPYWKKNVVTMIFNTNGGEIKPHEKQICAIAAGCNKKTCSDHCNKNGCENINGCSGTNSGVVYTVTHKFDGDAFKDNGIRDHVGDTATLYMKKGKKKGTHYYFVDSSGSGIKINEDKKYSQVKDFVNDTGKGEQFKRGNVTVQLFAEYKK